MSKTVKRLIAVWTIAVLIVGAFAAVPSAFAAAGSAASSGGESGRALLIRANLIAADPCAGTEKYIRQMNKAMNTPEGKTFSDLDPDAIQYMSKAELHATAADLNAFADDLEAITPPRAGADMHDDIIRFARLYADLVSRTEAIMKTGVSMPVAFMQAALEYFDKITVLSTRLENEMDDFAAACVN